MIEIHLLHQGFASLVKKFVKLGVPVNEQGESNWTALMWTVENDENHAIVRELIKSGRCFYILGYLFLYISDIIVSYSE